MANKKLYTIYDSKAKFFDVNLMPARNNSEAIRAFADGVNNPQTHLNKHPGDYMFFLVGEFDDETGMLVPQTPENLGLGSNFVKEVN